MSVLARTVRARVRHLRVSAEVPASSAVAHSARAQQGVFFAHPVVARGRPHAAYTLGRRASRQGARSHSVRSVFSISPKFVRRTRRRARVIVRSVLLHLVVLMLVGLGVFARMTESSDVQVASTRRASMMAALAVRDARSRAAALSAEAVAAERVMARLPALSLEPTPSRVSATE
jgi:hypothetical protein